MRVPSSFHNGKWTTTDVWMDLHPFWTYIMAFLVFTNFFLAVAVIVILTRVFSNEFHP